MYNYLELRKEELKKRGYKGFTLMEMLIVVAIIAVLIAIAIPVFSAQLNKAQLATDTANMRSQYSEKVADAMLDSATVATGTVSVELDPSTATNSTVSVDNSAHKVTVTHKSDSNLTESFNVDEGVTLSLKS